MNVHTIHGRLTRAPELTKGDEQNKDRVNFTVAVDRRFGDETDFFDCVMPARNARHGNLFTWEGKINLLNEKYMKDPRPIGLTCDCPACRNYSRSYIRHLIKAKESLGMRLAVTHNLYFYNNLTRKIREALEGGYFESFYQKYRVILGERCPD